MRNVVFASVATLVSVATSAGMAAEPSALSHLHDTTGAHHHALGEWSVGYQYRVTHSSGLRDGNDSVSNASVMAVYGEVPVKMEMAMHMLELMYGVSDRLSVMIMPQYMQMDMTHNSSHGGGHSHQHSVQGFGDTEVTASYRLLGEQQEDASQNTLLTFGASLPTGSTDETFVNHHGDTYRLPYNMQLGSGTVDPMIGLTYTHSTPELTFGARTLNYIRLGKNDEGYRLGNKYTAATWLSHTVFEHTVFTVRLEGEAWENVSGRDADLPLTTIAGADPKGQAGERVLAFVGVTLAGDAVLKGHRLNAEFGVPLYERYAGPQPDTDYRFGLGWKLTF